VPGVKVVRDRVITYSFSVAVTGIGAAGEEPVAGAGGPAPADVVAGTVEAAAGTVEAAAGTVDTGAVAAVVGAALVDGGAVAAGAGAWLTGAAVATEEDLLELEQPARTRPVIASTAVIAAALRPARRAGVGVVCRVSMVVAPRTDGRTARLTGLTSG